MMLAISAFGQSNFNVLSKESNDSYFVADYAAFNSATPGKVRLEVYYQIYNAALEFYRQGDVFAAEYDLNISVYLDKEVLADSYSSQKRVKVKTQAQSKSGYDYRTNVAVFELDPDKYKVRLTLRDTDSDKLRTLEFDCKLEHYAKSDARLSHMQLVQSASPVGDEPSPFDKGEFTLVPSVSKRYGADEALRLMYYFEIYQGDDPSDDVRVETVLRHATKGMLYRDSLTAEFENGVAKQFREISLEDLRPGEFRLTITLKGKRDKKLDERNKYFDLVWSERSLLKHDYDAVVSQLSMVGLQGDIDKLKELETYEDRLKGFNDFWAARDPSPGTPENEIKKEFYWRIRFANSNFSYLRRAGWKTDRGRVFVIYGDPDQVDDYPFVIDRKPYQEWHYYREARYRKFVFVDENGDGDFRLVYPYDGLGHRPDF